ncbi:MAG: VWA domain-containing protein [Epsilonproteobacteria bacterium]|nr:VWA domain-containing protein [Campylobacterota bacterium]
MKQLIFILLMFNMTFLNAMTKKADINVIDDWEYNATKAMDSRDRNAPTKALLGGKPMVMASPAMMPKKLGLSVGGAKDTNNFKANIENGYLPKLDSITYEGQFYNHYFDTGLGGKECKQLFCPSYSSAKRKNIFSDEKEYFLSVGLNSGIDTKDFKRKKLNLVVVLDISGSMGSSFDTYYYDKNGNKVENKEKQNKKKITIATESIVTMLSHLKDDDRVGIILFDHNAYLAKPLREVSKSDKEAIKKHILELKEQGGTNWSAGYKEALKLFDKIDLNKDYENRIVFLTDAMPNSGELRKDRLFGMAKKASKKGIHTTFIGIGVDFNTDLVEYVSKTKGANYFSVHSSDEFKKRLDKEFDYMVTPLVYDLVLKLDSKKYEIDAVYGSPEANLATGEIMKVNTLFPSSSENGKTKGGIILLKLKKIADGDDDIKLKVSYSDVNGKSYSNEQSAKFKKKDTYYDNTGIRKAILVSDYVTIMKNWLIDARAGCNDNVKWIMQEYPVIMKRCMIFPPKRPIYPTVKTWERKSCKLKVSEGYKKLFQTFKKYYISEMKAIGDESLQKELDIINLLLQQKSEAFDTKTHDDWQFVQQ